MILSSNYTLYTAHRCTPVLCSNDVLLHRISNRIKILQYDDNYVVFVNNKALCVIDGNRYRWLTNMRDINVQYNTYHNELIISAKNHVSFIHMCIGLTIDYISFDVHSLVSTSAMLIDLINNKYQWFNVGRYLYTNTDLFIGVDISLPIKFDKIKSIMYTYLP